MNVTIWYSTESMADYIIDHTCLRNHNCTKRRLMESDASKPSEFHRVPDHIKKILYLDAPDVIAEVDSNPIFTIEESKEAGTGHNAFQRFSRLAASAENGIPSFYIYPEAVIIERKNSPTRWDPINPLVFYALERLMEVFSTPAMIYFYPSSYPNAIINTQSKNNKGLKLYEGNIKYLSCPAVDAEMRELFRAIDCIVEKVEKNGMGSLMRLLSCEEFKNRRELMHKWFHDKSAGKSPDDMSPLSAVVRVPTSLVVDYIRSVGGVTSVGDLLPSRKETILYKVDAKFRGDPYPGALAAIDYMRARNGKTFEERDSNLVMAWGDVKSSPGGLILDGRASVQDFCDRTKNISKHNLLNKNYKMLRESGCIPRYYMQSRYGSTFSKSKEIRVYSYFCDAILFRDGALWREG